MKIIIIIIMKTQYKVKKGGNVLKDWEKSSKNDALKKITYG